MAKPPVRARKKKVPKPYKSWLEFNLHNNILSHLDYEGKTVLYDIVLKNRKYTPDFSNGDICLEAKGCFRDTHEAQKYVHLQRCGYDIRFIFQNPNRNLPWARKRKDGSRLTHAEWAEKNGFLWCGMNSIPKEWIK